jgi:hypothetical protein
LFVHFLSRLQPDAKLLAAATAQQKARKSENHRSESREEDVAALVGYLRSPSESDAASGFMG